MTSETRKIAAVKVAAPNVLDVTWRSGRTDHADLTAWIEGGGEILAPLADPAVFATARVDAHGRAITWGDDDDLAIDAHHLRLLIGQPETN